MGDTECVRVFCANCLQAENMSFNWSGVWIAMPERLCSRKNIKSSIKRRRQQKYATIWTTRNWIAFRKAIFFLFDNKTKPIGVFGVNGKIWFPINFYHSMECMNQQRYHIECAFPHRSWYDGVGDADITEIEWIFFRGNSPQSTVSSFSMVYNFRGFRKKESRERARDHLSSFQFSRICKQRQLSFINFIHRKTIEAILVYTRYLITIWCRLYMIVAASATAAPHLMDDTVLQE